MSHLCISHSSYSSINHVHVQEEAIEHHSKHLQPKEIIPREVCITKETQRVREKEKESYFNSSYDLTMRRGCLFILFHPQLLILSLQV